MKQYRPYIIIFILASIAMFFSSCSVQRIDWDSIPKAEQEQLKQQLFNNRNHARIYYGNGFIRNPYFNNWRSGLYPFGYEYNRPRIIIRPRTRVRTTRSVGTRNTVRPRTRTRVRQNTQQAPRNQPRVRPAPRPRGSNGGRSNAAPRGPRNDSRRNIPRGDKQ